MTAAPNTPTCPQSRQPARRRCQAVCPQNFCLQRRGHCVRTFDSVSGHDARPRSVRGQRYETALHWPDHRVKIALSNQPPYALRGLRSMAVRRSASILMKSLAVVQSPSKPRRVRIYIHDDGRRVPNLGRSLRGGSCYTIAAEAAAAERNRLPSPRNLALQQSLSML
jgi:hypothetical protein